MALDMVKDRDCVLIEHKTEGKVLAAYYQGQIVSLEMFLDVRSPYEDKDILGVYIPSEGSLEKVPLEEFRTTYKAIKQLV